MKNKYIIYIILFLITGIIISGFGIYSDQSGRLLKAGNELYSQEKYEEAGDLYEKGLIKNPADKRIKYNLANIRYQQEKYQEAFELYQNGPDSPDKYLLIGSSILFLSEQNEDPVQKTDSYQKALEVYKEGIIKYPRELRLKYNYEYIKNLLDDLENQQENQENDTEQNEQSEDNSKEENYENKEKEESKNEQNQDKDQEENSRGAEETENEQSQETGRQEIEPSDTDSDQSLEEIKQILKMLEKEEEESLKNNQSIHQGTIKEEKNDW